MPVIILDSNIFEKQKYSLATASFKLLFLQAKKLNASFMLSQIVLEEIRQHYLVQLRDAYEKYFTARVHLKNLRRSKTRRATIKRDELERLADDFLSHLKTTLMLGESSVISYGESDMKAAINKAIQRKEPCSSGQQIRDAIQWNGILRVGVEIKDKIIFISEDKDFRQGENLHPSLVEEAKGLGVKVDFYSSLSSFAEAYQAKPSFIDSVWLKRELNLDLIKLETKHLLERRGEQAVDLSPGEKLVSSSLATGEYSITSHFVNEIGPDHYRVQVELHGDFTVECDVERAPIQEPSYLFPSGQSIAQAAETSFEDEAFNALNFGGEWSAQVPDASLGQIVDSSWLDENPTPYLFSIPTVEGKDIRTSIDIELEVVVKDRRVHSWKIQRIH